MRRSVAARTLAVASLCALALSAGCADENTIDGSLTGFYDTSFQTVRARLYSSQLAVEYVRENGEVPVRIVVYREEGQRLEAGTYDLATRGAVTGRSHDTDIPPLVSGSITFDVLNYRDDEDAASGAESAIGTVEGSFEARFRTGEDTTSLDGTFSATVYPGSVPGYVIDGQWPPDIADASATSDATDAVDTGL